MKIIACWSDKGPLNTPGGRICRLSYNGKETKMKKAIIVGASGFGGLGLITILQRHPEIEIKQLIDIADIGKPISNIFPHLRGFCDMNIEGPDSTDYSDADIAFFSTPDQAGMKIIKTFFDKKIPVIDFSGDFRFNNMEDYGIYARNKDMDESHSSPEIMKKAVYGLPEVNAEIIKSAPVVGNPGCFATSMILGLLPAVEADLVDTNTIICDGKTGVSGAGKKPGDANYYPQRYENANPYREGKHQHLVEVENIINKRGAGSYRVLFVPQIVPLNRGILMTIYADLKEGIKPETVASCYKDYYNGKPFVIVTDSSPNITDVRGSNRCEIRPMIDERTGKLIITSVIDNLMKGQSGNAVQNANLMLQCEETAGLDIPAFYP